jgi:plastocyanin
VSFPFYFAVYYGSEALVSPGGYTEGVTLGISNTLQPNGENVILSSTSPAGINVTFSPTSPVALSGEKAVNVTLIITASSSLAPGNYTIGLKGVSGANSQSASFSVHVVQYRVVMTQDTFFPGVLNVTVGSTVYWQNFDGPAGGCGASTGTGQHNVVFTTLQGANSSTLNQFQIYKYTFTTAGSYFYYSSLDTGELMNGTINVMTAAGGMGNMAAMPVFSNLQGSGPTVPAAVPITSTGSEPFGALDESSPVVAGGSASSGTFVLSAHTPSLSSLVSDAGAVGLLGLIVSCAAMVMVALGKRSLTAISLGSQMRASPLRTRSGATQPSPTPAA